MKKLVQLLAVTGMAVSASTHAATMQFDMSAYNLTPGAGTFDVTLSVSDLVPDSQGGSEGVAFDPAVLSVANVVFGADYTSPFTPTWDASTPGSLVLDNPSFVIGGLPTNSDVATITFNILGPGTTTLALSSPATVNPWAYFDTTLQTAVPYCITDVMPPSGTCEVVLGGDNGGIVQAEAMVLTDSVVTVVPVPPAVWLFGSGLLGLVAIARRRAQRA